MDTFRIDVALPPADNVTLAGVSETKGPEGEELAESVMVPEKLFRLESVIVLVPDEPCESESEDGLLLTE